MDTLSKQENTNLTDRVTSLLRTQITGGTFKAGDVLPPESLIAERLGVSRTVLREAISRLKVEGLVASKQGKGLVILDARPSSVFRLHAANQDDVEELIGIVELRTGFEIEAAGFAAMRRDDSDLAAMRQALADMRAALDAGQVEAGVDADFAFHQAIARATRNPNYVRFFEFFTELYKKNLLASRSRSAKASRGELAQAEHERIVEAIRKGDAELARAAARTHLENTASRLRSSTGILRPVSKNRGGAKPAAKQLIF
ncbi:MAG TPA: FadR/GntR family transcriptional regulator [Burkholderiaceae bacterium]|nr:FadR/GntR family transcriptional regulator [Burkholderiaceae bacterium]